MAVMMEKQKALHRQEEEKKRQEIDDRYTFFL